MADKRIIKAKDVESSGASVEKVNLGLRKFNDKVFKDISLNEKPIAMEDEVPAIEFPEGETELDGVGDHQVQIERFYGDDGELQGLKITCRCGEVIDLEFTRDEDEALPEPGGEQHEGTDFPTGTEQAGITEGLTEPPQEETAARPDDSELEIEQFHSSDDLSGEQISVDNGAENIEIEEK